MANKAFSYGNCIENLAPLGKLRGLQILVLEGKACNDISALEGLPLSKVYFHDTAIVDLRPIRGCSTLYVLDIVDTPLIHEKTQVRLTWVSKRLPTVLTIKGLSLIHI